MKSAFSNESERYSGMDKVRASLSVLLLSMTIGCLPAKAEEQQLMAGCTSPPLPMVADGKWPVDAVCAYDFAEFNRRLLHLIEAPADSYSMSYLQQLINGPPFEQFTASQSTPYKVHILVLTGQAGWSAMIMPSEATFQHISKPRSHFGFRVYAKGPAGYKKERGCVSEAEVLTRALAAGYRFEVVNFTDRYEGPPYAGVLRAADERTLTLAHMSKFKTVPPIRKLKNVCAALLSYSEQRDVSQ